MIICGHTRVTMACSTVNMLANNCNDRLYTETARAVKPYTYIPAISLHSVHEFNLYCLLTEMVTSSGN